MPFSLHAFVSTKRQEASQGNVKPGSSAKTDYILFKMVTFFLPLKSNIRLVAKKKKPDYMYITVEPKSSSKFQLHWYVWYDWNSFSIRLHSICYAILNSITIL